MTHHPLIPSRAALYAAIDELAFAAHVSRPALALVIEARFSVYRTALDATPAVCLCAGCNEPTAAADLTPLASDETYARAVPDFSFERDDGLCLSCRTTFEADYGRPDHDVYSVYDAGDDDWDSHYADDLRSEGRGIYY